MMTTNRKCGRLCLLAISIILLLPMCATAGGTWTLLTPPFGNSTPAGLNLMLLLSDGTVMAAITGDPTYGQGVQNIWYRLTPDTHGSYVNGTWRLLARMHDTRDAYASVVLRDGRVFVAGGEYGSGRATAEVYDPQNNTWTSAPVPSSLLDPTQHSPVLASPNSDGNQGFIDSIAKILPDGRVLIAPVGPNHWGGTLIYDPIANSWTNGPNTFSAYQDEASWVKLPDDSILTVDPFGINSERYIPSLNQWVQDGIVPVSLYDSCDEIGPAFLLPDGHAFFIGGNGHTALYTPTGSTNPGTWVQGPDIPGGLAAPDAPAAMMVNGKILCAVSYPCSNENFPSPMHHYEYDPVANSFTQVSDPPFLSCPTCFPQPPPDPGPTYTAAMLDLPDGTVLYTHSTGSLFAYQPDGSPLVSGKPTISSITQNADGSYHLIGTKLNGISEGAAYGDDAQMDSNYPLVRLTDGSGNVYYARTYNWSSTSVMTGSTLISTEFRLPPSVAAGPYSLVAVANGNASDPVQFYGPIWVDFNSGNDSNIGSFSTPLKTMVHAISVVASGRTIALKPGISHETMTISKPMTIVAIGGAATIGQ